MLGTLHFIPPDSRWHDDGDGDVPVVCILQGDTSHSFSGIV